MSRFLRHFWLVMLFFLLPAIVNAQSEEEFSDQINTETEVSSPVREDFFIGLLGDVSYYGRSGPAYGGGITFGYGSGSSIGISFLFAVDTEKFIFMELLMFLRFYFLGANANRGPFIQIGGGPVLFADGKPEISGYGSISAGLSFGWRFLLGKHWYIEPVIRGGYPFLVGGGVSAGLRF